MREVVFKNMVSSNSRVKNILLKEIFERDGVVANTERRCFYFIKDVRALSEAQGVSPIAGRGEGIEPSGRRQFHIFKTHSDTANEDKLICKIIGTFYAISNSRVYTIAFLHSFKVRFTKARIQE